MKSGVTKTVDNLEKVVKAIEFLTGRQVFIGVPADKASRPGEEINSATLAYIHETGAPEVGIPARPFLGPTLKARRKEIEAELKEAGKLAMDGKPEAVLRQFARIGQRTVSAVQSYIQAGIPPPLQAATVRARRRRSKGSRYRRKAERPEDVVPLIDTGAMLRSISFVIRVVTGKKLRRR